jgi:hypothetical protein
VVLLPGRGGVVCCPERRCCPNGVVAQTRRLISERAVHMKHTPHITHTHRRRRRRMSESE